VPLEQRLLIAAPLLDDPFRSVRIEAGRVLAGLPSDRLDGPGAAALESALAEFEAAQRAVADTAAAHLNLAVLRNDRGEAAAAEAEYREAMRIGPDFLPAYFNLANFYNANQRNAEAEGVLRDALTKFPEEGELYYSLGLLLAEEQRLAEAAEVLAGAAERLPGRSRVQFYLGLALQHLGRRDVAREALERAYAIESADPSIVHGLAVFYTQSREWRRAAEFARRLVEMMPPGTAGPAELLRRIEDEIAAEAAGGDSR
jgi:tetratricopeptide (TPR) repeat protein